MVHHCAWHCLHPTTHACKLVYVYLSVYYANHMLFCTLLLTLGYQPAVYFVDLTANFSERLSTFTYSFQESCSLYPRCTPYFSVELTVSPLSVVSTTSSGCTVEYTISNLERCMTYHSTATAKLGNRRGNTIVVGNTVMLSEQERGLAC